MFDDPIWNIDRKEFFYICPITAGHILQFSCNRLGLGKILREAFILTSKKQRTAVLGHAYCRLLRREYTIRDRSKQI